MSTFSVQTVEALTADLEQILNGLGTVVGGVGPFRTHAGDAHGRGRGIARVDARIARLAVHAASTVSHFLVEAWPRTSGATPPVEG